MSKQNKSKQYRIKWTDNQQDSLRKAVRNYNDKIRRLEKKYPELQYSLPPKMTYSDMKSNIKTRQDLQREIRALNSFSSRKNVIEKTGQGTYKGMSTVYETNNNILLSNWQIKQMKKRQPKIDTARVEKRKEVEKLPAELRGQLLGHTLKDVGLPTELEVRLKPMESPFTPSMSHTYARQRFRSMVRESSNLYWESREDIFKEGYIKAIEETFGAEKEQGRVKKIARSIRKMTGDEFYSKYLKDQMKLEFYIGDVDKMEEYLTYLETTWTPKAKPKKSRSKKAK